MEKHTLLVILIILSGGILGGLANYFRKDSNKFSLNRFLKSILFGISAAFLVPVLFKLISSNLIQSSETNQIDYLIIFGFSVAAGIYSTNFIDSIGKKLLNIQEDLSSTKSELEYLTSEPEQIGDSYRDFGYKISEDEFSVLESFIYHNFIYRAISKIALDVNQDIETVRESLKVLQSKNLVISVQKAVGIKWMITDVGKEYYNYYKTTYGEDSTSFQI